MPTMSTRACWRRAAWPRTLALRWPAAAPARAAAAPQMPPPSDERQPALVLCGDAQEFFYLLFSPGSALSLGGD